MLSAPGKRQIDPKERTKSTQLTFRIGELANRNGYERTSAPCGRKKETARLNPATGWRWLDRSTHCLKSDYFLTIPNMTLALQTLDLNC
jgi:hypothetical protein